MWISGAIIAHVVAHNSDNVRVVAPAVVSPIPIAAAASASADASPSDLVFN